MSGPSSYMARVVANNGALVECIARGATARAALANLRRARRGDWLRIEVGHMTADGFRVLAEDCR